MLVHRCRKFSMRARVFPKCLTHSSTESPSLFPAMAAMASPHLLQFTSEPLHMFLALLMSLLQSGSPWHLLTAPPQILSAWSDRGDMLTLYFYWLLLSNMLQEL